MLSFKVPWTVRTFGCSAQPQKSVPSYCTTSLILRFSFSVNQFDDGSGRAVSSAMPGLRNARIASGPVFEARSNAIEQMLDEVFAIDERPLDLLFDAESELASGGAAGAVSHEQPASLSPSRDGVLLRQRDEGLDDPSEFFRPRHGRVNVAVANELARKVREQRFALIRWKSEFSSINLVSHRRSPSIHFVEGVEADGVATGAGLERISTLLKFLANLVQRL